MTFLPTGLSLTSFKGRLYALVGVSVLALGLFAVIAVYSIRDGTESLSEVYERQVEPAAALHAMEEALKDVRFRLAGYLLDQLPAVGNTNHLREAHGKIFDNWLRFKQATAGNAFEDHERELISQINGKLGNVDAMFAKLEQGYQSDDKRLLTQVLEDEWPFAIHAALLKPISHMVKMQQAAVGATYEASVERGNDKIALGIAILTVMTLLLAAFATRLTTGLTRRLDTAAEIANRVAAGDWSGEIEDDAHDEVGQLLRTIGHMRDQVHSRESRLETVLNNTAEGIITFDRWGVIEGFNQAAMRLFGWEEKDVIGTSVGLLIVADAHEQREGYLQHFLRNEIKQLVGHEGEVTGRHKDGSVFPVAIKISTITLEGRELCIALLADISERKAMMQRLKTMAERDGLTGLYNRRYFQGELERVVERVRRAGESNCALLYIDLDNFKFVNDTLGHAAGDQLLIQVAGILRKRARKSDLIARFGGDEFTTLVYDTTPEKAGLIADSFRQQIAGFVFHYEGRHVDIGCSIGVAMLGAKTRDAAKALSHADLACHLAKRGGRNRIHMFTETDAENVTSMSLDMGWSRRIKDAIEHGKFLLACQPIVNSRTREVTSYEVLVRMRDENDKLIMPAGFLPAAERFGLMLDIDRWVIVHAIDILVQHRKSVPNICYSINLSPHAMSSPGIGNVIKEAIDSTQIDPAALMFEVTENAAISDMHAAVQLLATLRGYGCRTALDDFGAGMSSFAYLQELPVDIVKIDGRFVKNLAANPVDQAMVRAMNDIAHAMGKKTVAEFVEDEASLKLLAEFGVDFAQGYYLGRPDITFPCKLLAERAGGDVMCLTHAG